MPTRTSARSPFPISVLGAITTAYGGAAQPRGLSLAKQRTLSALVAAGTTGATADELGGYSSRSEQAALRMSIARLRDHLPPGAIPDAVDGRYRLAVAVDEVDAWTLLRLTNGPLPDEIDVVALRHLLNAHEPYGGLADLDVVERSTTQLQRAQIALIEQVARSRPDLLRSELIEDLSAHLLRDPFNEQLLLVAAVALARSGDRRAAINALGHARREYADSGLPLSAAVAQLEHALIDGTFDEVGVVPIAPTQQAALPRPLADRLGSPLVGRDDGLNSLLGLLDVVSRRAVTATVSGPSGAGKTRLCAEVAAAARERGFATVYVAPSNRGGDVAFGPFAASLPSLRAAMSNDAFTEFDVAARKSHVWLDTVQALSDEAAGRPLLFIADDVQWLDSQSIELLAHLATTVFDHRIVLLAAGRDDGAQVTQWADLRTAMAHAGAIDVQPHTLTATSLAELVRHRRPTLGEQQVRHLADDLMRATRGFPGIANIIIDALDDDVSILPSFGRLSRHSAFGAILPTLSEKARRVAAVAGIIGPDFDVDALVAVGDFSEFEVLEGVDELIRRGLVIERSVVEFSTVHLVVQAALATSAPRHVAAQIHRRAAMRFHDDIHRRARHEADAVPLVDAAQARASLIASATALLKDGLYREAIGVYQRAMSLSQRELELDDYVGYTRGLDLSGAHDVARRERAEAFARAILTGNHATALHLATSGLPEVEPVDGDMVIVSQLLEVEREQLTRRDQWIHSLRLARQLAIVGRTDEALRAADQAQLLADGPDEAFGAAVCRRFAISATSPPEVRMAAMRTAAMPLESLGAAQRAELLFLRALDHYEAGDHVLARESHAEMLALGEQLPPQRRWHALLFSAMERSDAGDVVAAGIERRAAYEFGMSCGFAEHGIALIGAEFVDRWLRRSMLDLSSDGLQPSLDPDGPVLTRAALALVLDAMGSTEAATHIALAIARASIDAPVAQGTAALAMVSSILGRSDDAQTVEAARELIARRGNSMIVVGAGATCLGPALRYLAVMTPPGAKRMRHLVAACELADRSGSLLWRAIARRDLAELGGDSLAAAEFCDLIAGTALVDLDRTSSPP